MRRPARHAGMTLAELMVALAVGLGIVLGAGRLLVLANGAYAAQVESAAIDDGGRFAIDLIGRAVRQAGSVDPDAVASATDTAPARLAGLDARTLSRATPGIADPLPAAVNGSDVLAVRFPGAGPAPDGDGSAVDCAGFSVAAGEEGWSIFYVARNGDGDAELRCKYQGSTHWSADALVAGVDGFQVLYGVDTDDPPDGVANRYVNASGVDVLDAGLAGLGEAEFNRRTHWKRIVGVRVALLLHGSRPTRTAPGAVRHDLFGAGYAGAAGADDPGSSLDESRMSPDLRRRERRLFTVTVALPVPPS